MNDLAALEALKRIREAYQAIHEIFKGIDDKAQAAMQKKAA